MASIHEQLAVDISPDKAWALLREVSNAHKLFAPVLVDGHMEGDIRTVRFANGMTIREQILDVDDERRRVAYTALGGNGLAYHHASMEVLGAEAGRSLFVWITDFLPQEIGGNLAALMAEGAKALKNNMEAR